MIADDVARAYLDALRLWTEARKDQARRHEDFGAFDVCDEMLAHLQAMLAAVEAAE